MGGKKDAPIEAAEISNRQAQKGLDEIKRQFSRTQKTVAPFLNAGRAGLSSIQESATLDGLGDTLGRIFNGSQLDPLIEERTRAAQGQLAAGGLTRSGTALETVAAIPQELGLQIEQLLQGRQAGLADLGFNSAQLLGNFGQNSASSINSNLSQQGQNTASGILGKAQAQAGFTQGLLGLGSLAFSDPRLKVNVMKVAEIKDLGVYQWDWHPMLEGLSVADTPTLGFMADEVAEKYPEYSKEVAGFKCVAYGPLIDLMEQKIEAEIHKEAEEDPLTRKFEADKKHGQERLELRLNALDSKDWGGWL